ncbi:MAG: hypothetical protein ACK2UI_10590, partial [Anaerolineae bacterium]
DGRGKLGVFLRIILPNTVPALVTVALFTFLWTWDDFFNHLLYLTNPPIFSVSRALRTFVGDAGAVLQTNRGIPSSPVVRQATGVGASKTDAEVYRIYDAVADRTIPQDPNLPNDQEFVNELELIGQQVAYGQSSVDDAAADLQALIERLAVK